MDCAHPRWPPPCSSWWSWLVSDFALLAGRSAAVGRHYAGQYRPAGHRYVPQNPGGVPLGYLVQHAFLEAGGISRWTARLSSVLCAGGAVFLVGSAGAPGGRRAARAGGGDFRDAAHRAALRHRRPSVLAGYFSVGGGPGQRPLARRPSERRRAPRSSGCSLRSDCTRSHLPCL